MGACDSASSNVTHETPGTPEQAIRAFERGRSGWRIGGWRCDLDKWHPCHRALNQSQFSQLLLQQIPQMAWVGKKKKIAMTFLQLSRVNKAVHVEIEPYHLAPSIGLRVLQKFIELVEVLHPAVYELFHGMQSVPVQVRLFEPSRLIHLPCRVPDAAVEVEWAV